MEKDLDNALQDRSISYRTAINPRHAELFASNDILAAVPNDVRAPANIVAAAVEPTATTIKSSLPSTKQDKKAARIEKQHPRRQFRRPVPQPFISSLCNPIMLFRYSFFTWVGDLLSDGYARPLDETDLYELPPHMQAGFLTDRLEKAFLKNVAAGYKHPLLFALVQSNWKREIIGAGMFTTEMLCGLAMAATLSFLLNGFEDGRSKEYLYGVAAIYSSFALLRMYSMHLAAQHNWFLGTELRAAVIGLMYRKITKLRADGFATAGQGKIQTLMTADVERFFMMWMLFGILMAPTAILATAAVGWWQIGPSVLAGIAVTLLMIPVQIKLGRKFGRARAATAECTDKRVTVMSDVLHGMRGVKMSAWEEPISDKIERLRRTEIDRIRIASQLKGFTLSFFFCSSAIASYATITTYVLTGGTLSAAKVFTVASLFGAVRMITGGFLPMGIQISNELLVSIRRIEEILLVENEVGATADNPKFAPISAKERSIEHLKYKGAIGKKISTPASESNIVLKSIDEGSDSVVKPAIEIINFYTGWPGQWKEETDPVLAKSDRWSIANRFSVAKEPDLVDINLAVDFGELAVVMGPVGCGKTTLLLSLLGELAPFEGSTLCSSDNNALYSPQEAWVFPGSFRKNICFMYDYDAQWFKKVCDACALTRDFSLFEAGDLTEIGERGVTLSGGQKARVSLARTVYATNYFSNMNGSSDQKRCIVLLDDPFAAVDPSVGQEIFSKVVRGLLRQHAVVLATHHRHFARNADIVLNLDRQGKMISRTDDFSDVTVENTIDGLSEAKRETSRTKSADSVISPVEKKNTKAVAATENRVLGAIAFSVYAQYLKAAGSNLLIIIAFVLLTASQVSMVFVDVWLAKWTTLSEQEQDLERDSENYYHLKVYTAIVAGFVVLTFGRSVAYMHLAINASKGLHDQAFRAIMQCSMRFFDTQPIGRILNRFTKDLGYLDELLPETCLDFLALFLMSVATLIVVCIVDPYLVLAVVPCIAMFISLRAYYLQTARDIKRIEGTSRSPVYSHLGQTINGLSVLHSLPGATNKYLGLFEEYQDDHTRAWVAFIVVSRWLGSRLDSIVLVILIATVFAAVAQRNDNDEAGTIGLSLFYIMNLAGTFQWCVRQSAEVENQLTSAERVVEYGDLPKEVDEILAMEEDVTLQIQVPDSKWPENGSIEVKNLQLWYDVGGKAVLNGINFCVKAGEKIGVVGRTGAGKSSLFAGLLRMSPTRGDVAISGKLTKHLSLKLLRQCVTVIPQDPVLFRGTVRENLDPFDMVDDETLWTALEQVQLKNEIQSMQFGLLAEVQEFGANFSVGERQLICMARAIVGHSKILLVDEATANVDTETDTLIQKVIREVFKSATVITIAHRLNTIMDSDRIMVLDAGKVVEFDQPQTLISHGGFYAQLVRAQNTAKEA